MIWQSSRALGVHTWLTRCILVSFAVPAVSASLERSTLLSGHRARQLYAFAGQANLTDQTHAANAASEQDSSLPGNRSEQLCANQTRATNASQGQRGMPGNGTAPPCAGQTNATDAPWEQGSEPDGCGTQPCANQTDGTNASQGPHGMLPAYALPDPNRTNATCLCVFDIDRTLTGKHGDLDDCPNNTLLDMWDEAYGGGLVTLSALASSNISSTFCNKCYLGITSEGSGSGSGSPWNDYLLDHIMRSEMQDPFMSQNPSYKIWSYGTDIQSPYVLQMGLRIKQEAVELVRRWYAHRDREIYIDPRDVYFFGDHSENIKLFSEKGMNSREVSCASRDRELYSNTGTIGYCGATPQEIQKVAGNFLCDDLS